MMKLKKLLKLKNSISSNLLCNVFECNFLNIKNFSSNHHSKKHNSLKPEKEDKQANFRDLKIYFTPYFSSKNKVLLAAFGVTVFAKILITTSPYFLKVVVDGMIANKAFSYNLLLVFGFLITRIVGYSINEYRLILLNKISNEVILNFNKDMLKYLFKIDYKDFKNNSTNIINSFNKSIQGIDNLNRFIFGNVITNIIEFGIVSITLFGFLGFKYCLNILATYYLYTYFTKKIMVSRMPIMNNRHRLEVEAENKLSEIVHNIDNIKYFGQELREQNILQNKVLKVRLAENEAIESLVRLNTVQAIIISVGMSLGLAMGLLDIYNGILSPGDLLMIQAIFAQIMQPLFFLGTLMKGVAETKIKLQFAVDSIKNSREVELRTQNNTDLIRTNKYNIYFENVSFSYGSTNHFILKNFSCEFKHGEFTAIIGKSGQGKSTIFNLIVIF